MKTKSNLMYSFLKSRSWVFAFLLCLSCQNQQKIGVEEKQILAKSDSLVVDQIIDSVFYFADDFSEWVNYQSVQDVDFFHILGRGELIFSKGKGNFDILSMMKPDTLGGSVIRRNFYSRPDFTNAGLYYLRSPNEFVKLSWEDVKSESVFFQNNGFSSHSKVFQQDENSFYSISRNSSTDEWCVCKLSLEDKKLEPLIVMDMSDITHFDMNGQDMYLLPKNLPEFYRLSLDNNSLDTFKIEGQRVRDFSLKEEKPRDYFSLSMRDRIKYVGDSNIDFQFIDGFIIQILKIYRDSGSNEFEKNLLIVYKNGKIVEKIVPAGVLNLDQNGNVHFLKEVNDLTYIITTPVLDLVGWQ